MRLISVVLQTREKWAWVSRGMRLISVVLQAREKRACVSRGMRLFSVVFRKENSRPGWNIEVSQGLSQADDK
jgi:D-alanyl-D-alanine carboxypeptidase